MNVQDRPILYNPRRAIEHVETLPGLTPTRLYAVFFPLWYVEVAAIEDEQGTYDFIELYLERGIAECQLCTTQQLADFFGLNHQFVAKILHFLETIGHLTFRNNSWELSELGRASLLAGKRSTRKRAQQKLYFDAFQSSPLLREHYADTLQIFTALEVDEVTYSHRGGYQFYRLSSLEFWNPEALQRLEKNPGRDKLNVREELSGLRDLGHMMVYLPMYIIETHKRNNQLYYVAYTHIHGRHDSFFANLINSYPEIQQGLLASAETQSRVRDIWRTWLDRKGVTTILPTQNATGIWQIVLPAEFFRSPRSSFAVTDIGTYRLEQGYFMQIWCDNEALRRQAALDRILKIISPKKNLTASSVDEYLNRFAVQLHVHELQRAELRRRAAETGTTELVSILDRF